MRKRMPVDWVVNEQSYGSTGDVSNNTLSAIPLTLPLWTLDNSSFPSATQWGGKAFPEQDQGQLALRVRGHIRVVPTTWALGSEYRVMMRIVVKPYDFATELPSLDGNYALFSSTFANEQFNWQKLVNNQFGLGEAHEVVYVDVKMRQRIKHDEALWLIIENQTGFTSEVRFSPYLRTLMRAQQ